MPAFGLAYLFRDDELFTIYEQTPYMRETAKVIWKKMSELFKNKKNIQTWVEQYLDEDFVSGRVREDKRYELLLNYDKNNEHIVKNLKSDVERLVRLYTECYADISMIFILQPSCTEYILLYHQEQNWIDMSTSDGAGKYYELMQRIALILLTIPEEKFGQETTLNKLTERDNKLLKDARDLALNIKSGKCNPQVYLPCCVLKQVSEYLNYSYKQLNQLYENSQELKQIRNTFDIVTEDFSDATEEYRETIYLYEKEIQDNAFWKNKKL